MSGTSIIAKIFVPLSGFSLFLILPLVANIKNMEKPLKHQKRLGLGSWRWRDFKIMCDRNKMKLIKIDKMELKLIIKRSEIRTRVLMK